MLAALLLGIAAGALTTVSGLGGGQLLLLGLAALWDPRAALTVTGPALLVGNVHRLALFRGHLDGRVVRPYVLGALPGSLLGGLAAVSVPEGVLHVAMLGMAGLAALRAATGARFTAPPGALGPGGAVVGALAATGGGAGLIGGPLLLSAGLTGPGYVAAGAAGAITMHIGRMTAYGAAGWMTRESVGTGLLLAVAVMLGNAVGVRLRAWVPDDWSGRVELGAVGLCVGLALVAGST
ncbi:MAG: TSUP family transporter [Alphaproteobacteria bacterium]|nr:TSUP family transporter [Alphaproteobacteria bacterium]